MPATPTTIRRGPQVARSARPRPRSRARWRRRSGGPARAAGGRDDAGGLLERRAARPMRPTRAPSAARRIATARPIPVPAPVTRARLPCSRALVMVTSPPPLLRSAAAAGRLSARAGWVGPGDGIAPAGGTVSGARGVAGPPPPHDGREQRLPAVDVDDLAGHVRGLVAGQPGHEPGMVLGHREAAGRDERQEVLLRCRPR